MNKFKVGDVVWWSSNKEKVEISHIRLNGARIYIKSLLDGTWVLYPKAIKPIRRAYAILGDA